MNASWRMRELRELGVLAVVAAACVPNDQPVQAYGTGADADSCAAGFLGDEMQQPKLDLLVVEADGVIAPLHDGDAVPMILPPQGGRVIFIGVRATNVDPCALILSGGLRDLSSQRGQFNTRMIDLVPTSDGWGASAVASADRQTAISNFSNVSTCPNGWSTSNLYGTYYGLEVAIRDRGGRTATQEIRVVPECGEPANAPECFCICKSGYAVGEACDDGGADQ